MQRRPKKIKKRGGGIKGAGGGRIDYKFLALKSGGAPERSKKKGGDCEGVLQNLRKSKVRRSGKLETKERGQIHNVIEKRPGAEGVNGGGGKK